LTRGEEESERKTKGMRRTRTEITRITRKRGKRKKTKTKKKKKKKKKNIFLKFLFSLSKVLLNLVSFPRRFCPAVQQFLVIVG
jgi:hypothetical protein